MFSDYVLNGQGHGQVGEYMSQCRFETGLLRPWISDKDGKKYVSIRTGRWTVNKGQRVQLIENVRVNQLGEKYDLECPVANSTSLRKEQWLELDQIVIKAARLRLRAWADLAAGPGTYSGFDGMAKTILEHETMSDPGEAIMDMDGMTEGRSDMPLFQLQGLPLPITHSSFYFSQRKLSISQNGNMPLDSVMAEAAGRRIAEMIEKVTIGVQTGLTYGGNSTQVGGYGRNSTVYGYTNFPNRLIKTNMTAPTGSNPDVTLGDVLAARDQLYYNRFYGPFMIYHSTDWDKYLDNDYARLGGNNPSQSLRQRIRAIDGITDVRRLDYLDQATNPFTMIFVQQTPDVARAVIGMNITTLRWPSMGGMRQNFKTMCIMVPQLRADYNSRCGILQATTA